MDLLIFMHLQNEKHSRMDMQEMGFLEKSEWTTDQDGSSGYIWTVNFAEATCFLSREIRKVPDGPMSHQGSIPI